MIRTVFPKRVVRIIYNTFFLTKNSACLLKSACDILAKVHQNTTTINITIKPET